MPIEIKRFIAGPLENNTYLVSEGNKGLIVDPTIGLTELVPYLKKSQIIPVAILLTHGHFDHIMGIDDVQKSYPGLPVYISKYEIPYLTNSKFNGSEMIGVQYAYIGKYTEFTEGPLTIDSFTFTVYHIPGHSPGGSAFLFGNQCITGDSLFAGSIGRTDFPGCDGDILIDNIKIKLLTLPDDTVILAGHGGRSTIGREKRLNPFLVD